MAVQVFDKKDADYLKWLKANPNGFVLNTRRNLPRDYLLLHRASCKLISTYASRRPKGGFVQRNYVKIGGTVISDLKHWARSSGYKGKLYSPCGHCDPEGAWPSPASTADSEPLQAELPAGLKVVWKKLGSIDYFDDAQFQLPNGTFRNQQHAVVIADKLTWAVFDLTIRGNIAQLDYTPHEAVNKAREMYIGVMQVEFSDDKRLFVKDVCWKAKGKIEYQKADVSWNWRVGSKFKLPDPGKKQVKYAPSRVREGQGRFRELLLARFDYCCVTKETAERALEAAHIYPFDGEETNTEDNGLLLRADIHRLFDAGLIGINPKTFEVVVHADLQETSYAELAGERLKFKPGAEPSPIALRERWKMFSGK